MPTFEITVNLPEQFQSPVEVQRAFTESLGVSVQKVVKVQPKFPDLNGFDHLFIDTKALLDAVRHDSTPGSFEQPPEIRQQAPSIDERLHADVVALEGVVTRLRRTLEAALEVVK